MENPFGQLYYCKNECDLEAKEIPALKSDATAPLQGSTDKIKEAIAAVQQFSDAIRKCMFPFEVNDLVELTDHGDLAWNNSWGSDGKVAPSSYPYAAGDVGTVVHADSLIVKIKMVDHGGWWINLKPKDAKIWFKKK